MLFIMNQVIDLAIYRTVVVSKMERFTIILNISGPSMLILNMSYYALLEVNVQRIL
jgi:hypothetical protein